MSSSERQWRWANTATGNVEFIDEWWIIINALKNKYPATFLNAQDAINKPYLLRDEIAWGFSDTNFDYAQKDCTLNFATNNSPQTTRWIGGGRRVRKVFVLMEMSYRHIIGSRTDHYNNPPKRYMGTKKIIEHIMSSNSEWLRPQGITFIHSPSTIQDGKTFGNFGMINSITTPINMFTDNNKWKYILLFLLEIDEVLI